MSTAMLFKSFSDLAHALPHSRRNPRRDADNDGRQETVPRFHGNELELEPMHTIQNHMRAQDTWFEAEPLTELAHRVVSELEAERRDLRQVTLDEMKHRMVTARRAQLMAG